MSQTICILGRQPALGLAELESLYGSDVIHPVGERAAIVNLPPESINIDRLGGTIRVAKLLTRLDITNWSGITDYLVKHVPKHTCCIGPGKLTFGISVYGIRVNEQKIQHSALAVKKAVRTSDNRPVRVVPTKVSELSSAQVLHNNMTQLPLGMELLLIKDGEQVVLAQTTAIQNITAYAARDQARPKRDARIGMLPPKLAQIILNLATANTDPSRGAVVLDPFCGTGVILQEATLMGFDTYGTDIDPRMITHTDDNLQWLLSQPYCPVQRPKDTPLSTPWHYYRLEQADATTHRWDPPLNFIASEAYLGRPFSAMPQPNVLKKVMQDVDTITEKFLQNVARQTPIGFRLCVALPVWYSKDGFIHLKMLDSLEKLGYTRTSFVHADNRDLVYYRDGQIVGRELVTLTRK